MPTPLLWLLASASAFGPRTQRRAPLPPPPAASTMPVRVATGATGAAWVALGARTFDVESSRQLVGALGVATATFEDNIREPAAGFLELTSPVFVLEGALLVALAANVFEARPADAARVGASLALASAATLAGLAVATSSGAPVVDQGVVGPAVDLLFLTAAVAVKAVGASGVDDVAALLKGDAVDLATDRGESAGGGFYRTLATFYRGSTLVGILVGASFIFSPVNPIGIFETESAATHLFRAVCGIYIALVLCPAESLLWRCTKAGELDRATARALNGAVGLASGLLVVDGRVQVETGSKAFAELVNAQPDSLIVQMVNAGDVGRSETNTTAAFTVGLIVALFYLAQAAAPPAVDDAPR